MSEELLAAWLALSAQAESQVAAAAAAYEAGRMGGERFIETAALSVLAANTYATAYADTAVAAFRLATLGVPTSALGLLPPREEQERLIRAFATITAHAQAMSLADRSRRVARAEPLTRGRSAYQEALRARGVEQWRRVVMPDACEVCAPLAGSIHDMDDDFTDHPGCHCTLAPLVPETWGDEVRARQYQLRRTYETSSGQVRFSAGIRFR